MRAGRLNTRITLKTASTAQDSAGRVTKGPDAIVATLWAEKRHISGNERWASEHVTNTATVVFRIRYRTDIETSMWITHGGTDYQITGQPIDPDGRRTDMLITCTEVQVDGN
ncbi:phage head closure protein [Pontibacter sp. JAM-7]|uniref:phage head closure protein n=1 Tax=Pontibacter sp. JAM-7 TaxID=3366581 RepID=UPI003AF9D229